MELAGWWVPTSHPSRAVVLVPGLESDKSDKHVLKTASIYAGAGYGVLMIDLRAQGDSEGEHITMGYREVRDVRGALSWLKEQGFAPGEVVLHGFSMGGATVLGAAPTSEVAAVVEEGSYCREDREGLPRSHLLEDRRLRARRCLRPPPLSGEAPELPEDFGSPRFNPYIRSCLGITIATGVDSPRVDGCAAKR